ncbi:MAG: HEAT repeat domain-containing protein, partial [Thermoguttaceae bacterium]
TLLIYALGDLGEKAALPIVLKAAQSPARDIRQAAIHVLGTLGDEQAVPVLLATAIDEGSGLASVAQQSLVELEGDAIDAALTAQLAQSKGKALAVIIDLVGQRNVTSAVPTLIQAADDADTAVRNAAIQALGRTVGPDQLALLIGRVVTPKAGDTAGVAKEALRTACIRMPDRDVAAGKLLAAIPQASGEAKTSLFELVGLVGGTKALEGAREAARSENDETKDAATRVLGAWMSADAAPVLLDLAKTETSNKYKVRALRGYIRIARQLDMEPKQRMEMCRQAIEVAQRADEKRLAIEVLSRVHSAQALAQVVPYLQDASVKEAASDTAIKISDKIIQGAPKAVADAMKQVIAATGNKDLATRAKNLLALAEKKLSSK